MMMVVLREFSLQLVKLSGKQNQGWSVLLRKTQSKKVFMPLLKMAKLYFHLEEDNQKIN